MSLIQLASDLKAFGATVSGITGSYSLTDEPQKLVREHLPALIIGNFLGGKGDGFAPSTFLAGAPIQEVSLDHILLLRGFDAKLAESELQGMVATFVDAYITAARAYKYLTYSTSPVQQVVMSFTVKNRVALVGGQGYFAVVFNHQYTLYL